MNSISLSCSETDENSHRSCPTVITRDGDVIMFYPVRLCVCVCVCVCLCVCHDICSDYLTMMNWCHTYNIWQEYNYRYRDVQVICYIPMTSPITSPGQKVGQILKLPYLGKFFRTVWWLTFNFGIFIIKKTVSKQDRFWSELIWISTNIPNKTCNVFPRDEKFHSFSVTSCLK